MTVYDPEMKKMGRTDKQYTWWLPGHDNWHLRVVCESGNSKIEYLFFDPNQE